MVKIIKIETMWVRAESISNHYLLVAHDFSSCQPATLRLRHRCLGCLFNAVFVLDESTQKRSLSSTSSLLLLSPPRTSAFMRSASTKSLMARRRPPRAKHARDASVYETVAAVETAACTDTHRDESKRRCPVAHSVAAIVAILSKKPRRVMKSSVAKSSRICEPRA